MNACCWPGGEARTGSSAARSPCRAPRSEQMERWSPRDPGELPATSRETGCVEFLGETSHHSLAAARRRSRSSAAQVEDQADRVEALFGRRPTDLPQHRADPSTTASRGSPRNSGFDVLLGEGARPPAGLAQPAPRLPARTAASASSCSCCATTDFSDDIAFRFSEPRPGSEYPLTADTLRALAAQGAARGGPLRRPVHGLRDLRRAPVGRHRDLRLHGGPARRGVAARAASGSRPPPRSSPRPIRPRASTSPIPVSWADAERDLTAWLDNAMQRGSHEAVYALSARVRELAAEGHPEPLATWRKLSTSDHFYYMCVKFFSDGDVHKYFSPYATPHDAYIALANVLVRLRGPDRGASVRVPTRPRSRFRLLDSHRRPRSMNSSRCVPRHPLSFLEGAPRTRRLSLTAQGLIQGHDVPPPLRSQLGGRQQSRRHPHGRQLQGPRAVPGSSATATSSSAPGCTDSPRNRGRSFPRRATRPSPQACAARGISVRVGRWQVPGNPALHPGRVLEAVRVEGRDLRGPLGTSPRRLA